MNNQQTHQEANHTGSWFQRSIPGARESNAGDDFHILWAIRQALQLLDPRSGLRRVVMEGITPVDMAGADEFIFLGVDLTEYYGGDDLATATRVIASQLKYSTRHPDQVWTASRLSSANKRETPVIRRLANVYKGFLANAPRDQVLSKLSIWLVSNQPIETELKTSLEMAQTQLRNSQNINRTVQARYLLNRLPQDARQTLNTLQQAAGLPSSQFTDFLRVLDFSHCGEESRTFQQLRVIQRLGIMLSAGPLAGLRSLHDLVRKQAMPEEARSPGLTSADLLAALGIADMDQLFPAPSRLEPHESAIETSDIRALVATITGATRPVLAHGGAGVGKTTTVQQLEHHLPQDSVAIIYDCYGNGEYLAFGQQRHSPGRAFVQIINELTIRCGSPLLLSAPQDRADLERVFSKSLKKAAEIIAATDGALLVLVIDAADNSIVAAHEVGDESFVPRLWGLTLPENCRLVMTSRSHRRERLQPVNAVEHELVGFDEVASTSHLRRSFPEATSEQGRQFHDQTGGNPRWQDYRLRSITGLADYADRNAALANLLAHPQGTLNDMFQDLWEAAIERAADPRKAAHYLAILMCLARPVSLHLLANTCSISYQEAQNICSALTPGVIVENDAVSFRDEDFETHLRDNLSAAQIVAAHDHLATYFLERREQDAYAARYVAEHLVHAKRVQEVIALAVEGPAPMAIGNNLLRLEVTRRRIALAMQAALDLGDVYNGLRLILLAANNARSNGALTALIRESPELAAMYGDIHTVARLYLREENSSWLGAAHLRIAAMYARDPAQQDAASHHLEAAAAWIRRYMTTDDHNWIITSHDIACGAEAVFWLEGSERAVKWLRRWRPLQIVLEAIDDLVSSLSKSLRQDQLDTLLSQVRIPSWAMAMVLAGLWRSRCLPAYEIVNQTAEWLDRAIQRGKLHRELSANSAIDFCELAAARGVASDRILRIIETLGPAFPSSIPYEWDDLSPYDLPLRAVCLQAALTDQDLTTAALLPEQYRQTANSAQDYERHRFDETVGRMLGVYKVRVHAIVQESSVAAIREDLLNSIEAYRRESEHRWFRFSRRYALWATRACDALLRCEGDTNELIQAIADTAEMLVRAAAPGLWIDMASLLLHADGNQSLAFRLLDRAARFVNEKPLPGSERWQVLLRCAETASRYDTSLSQEYYRNSLAAAEGIDDENAALLALQSQMAGLVAGHLPPSDRRSLAGRLGRLAEAYEPFTSSQSVIPWETILTAVTCLDTPSGFALSSRWDDENRLDLKEGIVPVVREATSAGFITPIEGLALLRLAGEQYDISVEAIPLLERLYRDGDIGRPHLAQLSRMVSDWIRYDVAPQQRKDAGKRVIAWATAHKLEHLSGMESLRSMVDFAEQIQQRRTPEVAQLYRIHAEEHPTLEDLMADAQAGSLHDFDVRLRAVCGQSYDPHVVRDYLLTLGKAQAPSVREMFLNLLIATDVRSYYAKGIVAGLAACLCEWRAWQPITHWIFPGLKCFLGDHLHAVLQADSSGETLQKLLAVPQLDNKSRYALLLISVIHHMEALTSSELYSTARAMTTILPPDMLYKALEWSITWEEAKITNEGKTLEGIPRPPLGDTSTILARFLWAILGHPDKHVRWRALHAARQMNLHTNPSLLAKLVESSWLTSADSFRSPHLSFYWMSARAWLLVLLDRVAADHPEALAQHIQAIADHALNPELPHAQIRELARRTVLRVLQGIPEALQPSVVEQLRQVNAPTGCLLPVPVTVSDYRAELAARLLPPEESQTRRFSFPLDVPEYWFAHLARVFCVGTKEIARRAEIWIVDRWGYTDEDWWRDQRELSRRYERRSEIRHQSGAPSVETLHIYLAYHAMCCVAGEMIGQLPVDVKVYDDGPSDPWETWIAQHITTREDYWLADLRTPTPYRTDCWEQVSSASDRWQHVDEVEYEEALGFAEASQLDEMVVYGHHTVHHQQWRGTVRVISALVNPVTAHSLMCALYTTDPDDYTLPITRYTYGEAEFDEPGFELQAWLQDQKHKDPGLDEYDELGQLGASTLIGFSEDFLTHSGVIHQPKLHKYILPTGVSLGRRELWNAKPETYQDAYDYAPESYSAGERLWVRINPLLDYLRLRDRDLIIKIEIDRGRVSRDYREGWKKRDPRRARIYLLRRDGTLETLAGSRSLR